MFTHFNLEQFISAHITHRKSNLLDDDFSNNDAELHKQIDGKSALVIGGAGTIGSYYIKALLRFKPERLYVIDTNENGLTELVRDLRSSVGYNIPKDFITYPVNFSDRVFEKIFHQFAPFDIVANFAAHKHVRSEKDIFSVEAMILNNVLRARRLLNLLMEFPPEHFFCVSTDKAANPVNIMGASKKLMEELIMAYSSEIPITTARFANVAFSNGSLPLGFLERINRRQPLSCPLGIKRFFVSPAESGEICLAASVLGQSGDIFFPKLDENKDMLDFSEIALTLLNSLGLEADICKTEDEARKKALMLGDKMTSYPVYFFESDTSGEKSFEEFYTNNEILDLNTFINLGIIKNAPKRNISEIDSVFRRLETLFSSSTVSKSSIVEILKGYLPNFEHIEKGKHLDQRM
ncbi:MAG: polysaccharide biosynthesis protein [Prevotellaceae bacterium]|jgi:FlaA1/EpsC-like NDP-sugar epimerase|nr:polysaccharide biosynthesis protein [Prevotellaceae bacterium]